MDRSGDRKRKAPGSSSSARLVLEPGWLSLNMATPYRCHVCLRAFTSRHALVGHYNAHRSKRLVHGPAWQSQAMAAHLKVVWQRQSLLRWRSMVQPIPPVPMAQPLPPVPMVQPVPRVPVAQPLPPVPMVQPVPRVPVARPSPNPFQQPTNMVFRVPVEASINESKREGKMPVYTPGRQNPIILYDRSATARGESNYVQAAKKQKMAYAPGASSSEPRPREGVKVQTEKKRKMVNVGPVPARAPGPSRFGPNRLSSKAETLDLELRL